MIDKSKAVTGRNIACGNIVEFKHAFTKRLYKVVDIRDEWEAKIEDLVYGGSSWWRLDSLQLAYKDDYPEYFL